MPRQQAERTRARQRFGARDPLYGRSLTPRAWQVLWCLSCGLSNREMAAKLGLSVNTIKNRMTWLMRVLGARDRTHVLVLAIITRPALEA